MSSSCALTVTPISVVHAALPARTQKAAHEPTCDCQECRDIRPSGTLMAAALLTTTSPVVLPTGELTEAPARSLLNPIGKSMPLFGNKRLPPTGPPSPMSGGIPIVLVETAGQSEEPLGGVGMEVLSEDDEDTEDGQSVICKNTFLEVVDEHAEASRHVVRSTSCPIFGARANVQNMRTSGRGGAGPACRRYTDSTAALATLPQVKGLTGELADQGEKRGQLDDRRPAQSNPAITAPYVFHAAAPARLQAPKSAPPTPVLAPKVLAPMLPIVRRPLGGGLVGISGGPTPPDLSAPLGWPPLPQSLLCGRVVVGGVSPSGQSPSASGRSGSPKNYKKKQSPIMQSAAVRRISSSSTITPCGNSDRGLEELPYWSDVEVSSGDGGAHCDGDNCDIAKRDLEEANLDADSPFADRTTLVSEHTQVEQLAIREGSTQAEIVAAFEEGTLTSVMVRNVPKVFNRRQLLTELRNLGFGTEGMDFFYLPFDFGSKLNKGYAFVNFVTPASAAAFFLRVDGLSLPGSKPLAVRPAAVQGWHANVRNFLCGPSRKIRKLHFRPLIFNGGCASPLTDRAIKALLSDMPTPRGIGDVSGASGSIRGVTRHQLKSLADLTGESKVNAASLDPAATGDTDDAFGDSDQHRFLVDDREGRAHGVAH